MKHSIFILLFSCLLIPLFSQSNNDGTASQKVMQAERNIIKAIIGGDTKSLNILFADSYKGYFENEALDKDFILKHYNQAGKGVMAKDINMDARIYGNAAVVHGVWELRNEKDKPYYFQFTDMFIQKNNLWQQVSSQQNPIPVWKARNNLNDSEFESISAFNCDSASTLKSLNSNVPAFIRFKNDTSDSLTVYWINYDGVKDTSAEQIRPVEGGKFIDVQTFLTHPFIVMGSNNKCYGIYEATTNPSIAIIKD